MHFPDTARRIDSLGAEASGSLVLGLAARQHDLITELNRRLDAIEGALANGDWGSALRAADSEPGLPRLLEASRIQNPAAWSARVEELSCGARRTLPAPVARTHAALASLASRPMAEDDAVPLAYRSAMRSGALEEAWRQLRLWRWAEPADASLEQQRAEIERTLAEHWLGELMAAPAQDADPKLLARLASLPKSLVEALPAWQRAMDAFHEAGRRNRMNRLAEAERLSEGDTEPTAVLAFAEAAGEVRLLCDEAPAADASLRDRLDQLVTRADAGLSRLRRREAARRRLAQIAVDIPGSEEAYEDGELLELAAELTRLQSDLPETEAGQAAELATEARRLLSQRNWAGRRRTGARALLALTAFALVAAVGYQVTQRLDRAGTQEPGSETASQPTAAPVSQPRPEPAVEAVAEEFFRRARETEQELAQPASVRSAVRVSARLAELVELAAGLSPARQREADARLSVLRASLAAWRSDLQESARQALATIEARRRADLAVGSSPEQQRRGLAQILPLLGPILETAEAEVIGLPAVLGSQLEAILRDLTEAEQRVAAFEAAERAVRESRTDADYRRALSSLAAAPYPEDARVRAASSLVQRLPTASSLVAAAFAGGNPEAFQAAVSTIEPAAGSVAAPSALVALLTDPAVRDAHQYVFVTRTEGASGTPVVVFTAGPMVSEEFSLGGELRTRQSARIITGEGIFEREFISRVGTDGQRRGESLELGYRTPEGALAEQLGQMLTAEGRFQQSPLAFVEALVNDEQASPLLRAQLLLALAPALEARPAESGLSYSPGARELIAGIRQVTGGSIRPQAWVEPAFLGLGSQVARELRKAAPAALVAEASWVRSVFARLAAERFEFAGLVDGQGGFNLIASTPETRLWAFTGETLRFRTVGRPEEPPPVPFSPLYRFTGDAPALVREALATADLPEASLQRLRRQFDWVR